MALDVSVLSGIVSGVALILLAVFLWVLRPQGEAASLFVAFALAAGARFVVGNVVRVDARFLPVSFFTAHSGLQIIETYFLVRFALAATPDVSGISRWALRAISWGIAPIIAVFAIEPALFIAPSQAGFVFGPLQFPLVVIPNTVAYVAGAVHILHGIDRAPLARRSQLGILGSSLLLNVGYVTLQLTLDVSLQWAFAVAALGVANASLVLVSNAACALALIGLAVTAPPRTRRFVAPAVLLTAALAIGSELPLLFGGRSIPIGGIVRFAAIALLGYGVVRGELFHVDLRLKSWAPRALPFVIFFLASAISAGIPAVTTGTINGVPLLIAGPVTVGAMAGVVAIPLGSGLARTVWRRVDDNDAYRRSRALEVYQSALAQSLGQNTSVEDDPILETLRQKLNITQQDHETLLYAVQAERAALARAPERAPSRYARERLLKDSPQVKVWLARDETLGRAVVLKEFQTPADPAAQAEARAGAGLDNPHVVTLHDVLEEDGRMTLVMEYVESGSLQELVEREGKLPQARALALTADVLRGLVAIHARDLVHQDIKPANVLLAKDGRAKVSDLGIAERRVAADEAARETGTMVAGPAAGTLYYMSPEQAAGGRIDITSDIYSTGALLYRLLAGRHHLPFEGKPEYEARRLIVEAPSALPIAEADARVNAILERSLRKDPVERYPSAVEMLADVERALRGDHVAVASTSGAFAGEGSGAATV